MDMTRKTLVKGLFGAAVAAPLALAGCSRDTGGGATSEGDGTPCEVTGYTSYAGSHPGAFPAPGDRVAVISPSATPSQAQVDATVAGLEAWGYVPVQGKYVCVKTRTLAQCVEDLEWALADPTIKAIFCVRGGYAASEVMDLVPLAHVADAGKLIIGYSDITVYHAAWTTAGLPSIHASMAATFMDLPEACVEPTRRLLAGEVPSYRVGRSPLCVNGEASGVLIAGNLSTLTSTLGTVYDCTKIGRPYILVLEDVEEDMQHIHRFLAILKHLGVLTGAAGIILGEWTDVPASTGDYSGDSRGGIFTSVADMIDRQYFHDAKIPVAYGFPVGHGKTNYPLLVGEVAHLTVTDDAVTLEWSGR